MNALRALLSLSFLLLAACMCERHQPTSLAGYSGGRLYTVLCAGCHGLDARGNGPIAPYISVVPPDLTHISARHNGKFPASEIYQIVDGQADLPSRERRHMPIWGYELFDSDLDDRAAHQQATDIVGRVVDYLASIQQ